MRARFEEQLELLNVELIKMGALCEDAIASSTKALISGDEELRKNVFDTDREIDRKEKEIETLCMKLLLQQQPVAKAFRLRHMLIAQKWYLFAIREYLKMNGGSRGSYLVVDPDGTSPHPGLEDYKIKVENKTLQKSVQVVSLIDGKLFVDCEACRNIPTQSFWFERVWADFKKQSFFTVH